MSSLFRSPLSRRLGKLTLAAHLIVFIAALYTVRSPAGPPQLGPRNLGFDVDALNAIDDVAEQAIRDGETPGVVVCVGRSDGIAFLKAYGQRQVEPAPEAMTTDTVFDMASLTKPVSTATCVMHLVQQGKLSPKDPVAKHLPAFGQNGKSEITVEQLLLHTSGLIPDNSLKDYEDGPEKAWERIFALAPVAEPGTKFQYSDVNYLVLGKLVEMLSRKPLNECAREMTFEPLGMTDTGYLPSDELKARCAATEKEGDIWLKGRVHDPRSAKLGGVAGHAGLFSTATDLATYATAMLKSLSTSDRTFDGAGGQWNSGKRDLLLLPRIAVEMTTPRDVPRGKRAYGWDVRTGFSSNRGEAFSDAAFGHGGFTGTAMWIDPKLDLYVIWLSTRLHPDGKGSINPLAGKVGTIAADALLDRKTAENDPDQSLAVSPVLTGIDVLKRDGFASLKGRKIGLITNHTGRSREGTTTVELLAKADGVELVALFSPEHGFEGKLDESGIGETRDPATGVRVFSLYGETRTPTAAMLANLDTLVFDIQDIGARFYTYVSTMGEAMKAASEHGKRFVVLDRPNPIGGLDVAGPMLDAAKESFVGFHRLPVRHGLTIGELARLFEDELKLKLDLEVIECVGWHRADAWDATGLPVFSLYGETRKPTAQMLESIDTIVFDIQDIGSRFYTYVSTMGEAMKAASEHGKRFVVLDRPNPIGGLAVAGPMLDAGKESFVGFHTIAVRHGMTIGELAMMYKAEHKLDLDLQVVRMEGWNRADYFDKTALTWINPSPNMRSLMQATLYPGVGLLETTNISVGRGTDTPFEILGAPWIDAVALATHLNERRLPGVRFVPVRFTPDASKFANEECGGVNLIVVNRAAFQPVATGLAIAIQLRHDYPDDWETRSFDRLLSDKTVYDAVLAGRETQDVQSIYSAELEAFKARRAANLLYE
jgi:uncharacterized protein YbbC (DUF1343 family)/CubicO group peptidase (beta-lactamase class C family)